MIFMDIYVLVATDRAFSFLRTGRNSALVILLIQELATGGASLVMICAGSTPFRGSVGMCKGRRCQHYRYIDAAVIKGFHRCGLAIDRNRNILVEEVALLG